MNALNPLISMELERRIDNRNVSIRPSTLLSETGVYRRTQLGQVESRNRQSVVPPRLRSILLLVDGRTPVNRYLRTLTVYPDLVELFQGLLDLELIEPVEINTRALDQTIAAKTAKPAGRPQVSNSQLEPGRKVIVDPFLRKALDQLATWVPELFPGAESAVMVELDKCTSRPVFAAAVNEMSALMAKRWGSREAHDRLTRLEQILLGKA